MPIREFVCRRKHVTERILTGKADETVQKIECPHVMSSVKKITCGEMAHRRDVSQTAPPVLMAGCGGFYKPTRRSNA